MRNSPSPSAAENARSFMANKGSPAPANSPKSSPIIGDVSRRSLSKAKLWETDTYQESSGTRITKDLISRKAVSNSPFLQQQLRVDTIVSVVPISGSKDQHDNSPSIGRHEEIRGTESDPEEDPASSHPRSVLSSPEKDYLPLRRRRTVTFNDSPEVRHMSAASFETVSSPTSISEDEYEEDHGNEMFEDDLETEHPQDWATTTPTRRSLVSLDDPFDTYNTARSPLAITHGRPLPRIPLPQLHIEETKLKIANEGTKQLAYTGLGIYMPDGTEALATAVSSDLNTGTTFTDCSVDFDIGETPDLIEDRESSAEPEEAQLSSSSQWPLTDSEDVSLDQAITAVRSESPMARTSLNEPAISREIIREKIAQRKAAALANSVSKEEPSNQLISTEDLAPALPHLPGLPYSIAGDVSLTDERISSIEKPGSHESSQTEISQTDPVASADVPMFRTTAIAIGDGQSPVIVPRVLEKISYDGDDYEDDYGDEQISEIAQIHSQNSSSFDAVKESTMNESQRPGIPQVWQMAESLSSSRYGTPDNTEDSIKSAQENEDVLKDLPEIPDVPNQEAFARNRGALDMKHMSLSLSDIGDDSLGLEGWMTPSPPQTPTTPRTIDQRYASLSSPFRTPPAHRLSSSFDNRQSNPESPAGVPISLATVTSRETGGRLLKTRPSNVPGNASELAKRRRKISNELYPEESVEDELDRDDQSNIGAAFSQPPTNEDTVHHIDRNNDEVRSIAPSLNMSTPVLESTLPTGFDAGFDDISRAFDRVIESQKRGYVMRQQSQVVHAKADDDEEDASIRGHTRQSSSVYTTASTFSHRRAKTSENVITPPREGSKSSQHKKASSTTNITSHVRCKSGKVDGGKLFVKIVGVRNVVLPIPLDEESQFCCMLDNGKHCVTTPWHTLGATAKIGQEFEL